MPYSAATSRSKITTIMYVHREVIRRVPGRYALLVPPSGSGVSGQGRSWGRLCLLDSALGFFSFFFCQNHVLHIYVGFILRGGHFQSQSYLTLIFQCSLLSISYQKVLLLNLLILLVIYLQNHERKFLFLFLLVFHKYMNLL